MNENFAELFQESISKEKVYPGAIVSGTIVDIGGEFIIVNAGLKSEGRIPKNQFYDEQGELEVNIGDEVDLAVEALENGWGETQLSREKAKRLYSWIKLEKSYKANDTVVGLVTGRVKGGFTVDVQGVKAFLPGSLVDIRPVRDPEELEGKELEFKVIKMDQKRNNVVVSRRPILEGDNSVERAALLEKLYEGQELAGIIKNLTDYGAFVDLGGVDGLLHITDMSWRRIKHPSEVVEVGQEVKVKILKFDREKSRVSLGLKQLGSDPWLEIAARYPEGTRMSGVVTNITDYGCFVEIEEGVEGLVHVSEMDWTNKNVHPNKIVQLGLETEVLVLDIDEDRRRISLGIKQCTENPWDAFAGEHNKGDKIAGVIKSITDFGIFVGLDGEIDGLVHLSDVSWNSDTGIEILRSFKKGDEIETVILAIDAERERISLGIKQLEQGPFAEYLTQYSKGMVVKGIIKEVTAKGATIQLADDVEGYLRATELTRDRVEDARTYLKEGEEIEAKITGLDRKNNSIMLSIKAKDMEEEKEALQQLSRNSAGSGSTTLGDLFKDQMNDEGSEEKDS